MSEASLPSESSSDVSRLVARLLPTPFCFFLCVCVMHTKTGSVPAVLCCAVQCIGVQAHFKSVLESVSINSNNGAESLDAVILLPFSQTLSVCRKKSSANRSAARTRLD